jgi:hypothetical protein
MQNAPNFNIANLPPQPPLDDGDTPTVEDVASSADYAYRAQGANFLSAYEAVTAEQQGSIEMWKHRVLEAHCGLPAWYDSMVNDLNQIVRTCFREAEEKSFARTKNAAAVLRHHRIHALQDENGEEPEQFPQTRGELENADREVLVNLAQFYGLPRVEGYPLVPLKEYLHILD